MPGWNLKTYEEEFNSLVNLGASLTATSPASPHRVDFNRRINEALNRINRVWGAGKARTATGTITASTTAYTIPDDTQGRDLRVWVKTSSTAKPIELAYRALGDFENIYDITDTTDDSGTMAHWTFDPSDPTQILIRPVPSTTVSNGLIFQRTARPTPLRRAFYNASATADATNGNAAVTINHGTASTIPITSAQVADDDEFSIVPTTRLDQVAYPLTMSGLYWERMSSVTVDSNSPTNTQTSVTLANAWGSDSVTGGKFITAQVSTLERMWPGEMGFAPALLAASMHLRGRSPQRSGALLEEAAALLGVRPDVLLGGHRRRPPLPDAERVQLGVLSA